MDILYLLVPLSAVLALAILGVFAWALRQGQFDDLEDEGTRILAPDGPAVDVHQGSSATAPEQCPRRHHG